VIDREKLVEVVKQAYISACKRLPKRVKERLRDALLEEKEGLARLSLEVLLENAELAEKEGLPLCQDTGVAVVWVKACEEFELKGLKEAINQGVALACKEGRLRASVCDPITRKNTGNNTPAIIHFELVKEPVLEICVLPKGCGSENMSQIRMLSPAKGVEGIVDFVTEVVKSAGPNPCPPVSLGIGIGGDFETAALLSKKALFRDPGTPHPDPEIANLEKRILERVNTLGIGPLGFGGKTTCLFVHIETHPCHIASLPVAVNVQCHCYRLEKVKVV